MIITEGKTKRIVSTDNPNEVLIETKDDLTGGDAAKKETISGISIHKTTQTTNAFNLLSKAGIPSAYLRKESENSFICESCDMLPLELVTRRFAWGSYLKRHPDLVSTKEAPHRFDSIQAELFHKHAVVVPPLVESSSQMEEGQARDAYLKDGVWKSGVFTDPYLETGEGTWKLHNPKAPILDETTLLSIDAMMSEEELRELVEGIMIPTFETLEKAWAGIQVEGSPVALVDMKIEVGRRKRDGKIVLADVIDNDSWRIWPGADPKRQLDKQCFREDAALSTVANNYELVARLTDSF
jgi:phosphoribosylaminoimidazole-succinocarboxamide synthase